LTLLKSIGVELQQHDNRIQISPLAEVISQTITLESDWSSASYYYAIIALAPVGTSISLNTFFPGESISQVHGKLLKKKVHFIVGEKRITMPNEYYLPLYHPAAAMYNGTLRETLVEDFKKIPLILKNIPE
jgi:5-enolpyruvylshikimate-3-phosphate synthase